jgi:hypothetical protein
VAHPGALETHSRAMEAHTSFLAGPGYSYWSSRGAHWSPGALESRPGAINGGSSWSPGPSFESIDTHPRTMDDHLMLWRFNCEPLEMELQQRLSIFNKAGDTFHTVGTMFSFFYVYTWNRVKNSF